MRNRSWSVNLSGLLLACPPSAAVSVDAADQSVKVFILAGQSNMKGKAQNSLLEYQAEAPETKELFKHLRKDGKWIVRTDVLADQAAEKVYPEWSKRMEEWKKVGSDRGYHYLGSAIWYMRIGRTMGDSMKELLATGNKEHAAAGDRKP